VKKIKTENGKGAKKPVGNIKKKAQLAEKIKGKKEQVRRVKRTILVSGASLDSLLLTSIRTSFINGPETLLDFVADQICRQEGEN
jgi:hypothetical protein